MAIQKIFRSGMPAFRYVAKNGTHAIFMNGKFITDNKEIEDELMREVGEVGRNKSRHPFIFIDEAEPEFDTEAPTAIDIIKRQAKEEARQELLAEMAAQQARAMNASANVSTSDTASSAGSLLTTAKLVEGSAPNAGVQMLQVSSQPEQATGATAVQLTGLAALKAKMGQQ